MAPTGIVKSLVDSSPQVVPPSLPGELLTLDQRARPLAVYRAGEALPGPPALLVHSLNAAASAYEIRPVFLHLGATRPVYALDLPGFGCSSRAQRPYTPRLLTDAVLDVSSEIRRRHPSLPIDLLGLSLGSELVARAALEAPEQFRSLALVSPTGFNGKKRFYGPAGSTREVALARWLLHERAYAPALFRALTRPGVVRYFLERTFGKKEIDEGLWAHAVATAQAEGAHLAPLAFLSASLFSADINGVYEALTLPVWMSHGGRGDFVDYRGQTTVAQRPNWTITTFSTGAMPYFEEPEAFFAAADAFWAKVPGR